MLEQFAEILTEQRPEPAEEVLDFPEYLDVLKREPWIARNTFQLLHDMMLSAGALGPRVPGIGKARADGAVTNALNAGFKLFFVRGIH